MRVSLTADPAEFVKQIADARRFFNKLEAGRPGSQEAMTARFMTAALVPFLGTLRTELRQDGYDPATLLTAASELIGNIASSVVQSLYDAPPEVQRDAIQRILSGAYDNACMTIENDARMARDAEVQAAPKLAIVNPDVSNVVILPLNKGE